MTAKTTAPEDDRSAPATRALSRAMAAARLPVTTWAGRVRQGWIDGNLHADEARAEYLAAKERFREAEARTRGRSR